MLDLLLPRLESLGAEWEFWDNHDSPQIPLDAFRSVVSVCMTSCLILTLVQDDVPSPELSAVDVILERLLNLVRSPRFFANGSSSGLEAIISVVQPYMPEITSSEMNIFTILAADWQSCSTRCLKDLKASGPKRIWPPVWTISWI